MGCRMVNFTGPKGREGESRENKEISPVRKFA